MQQHFRLAACFFLYALITGAMYSRLPDIQLRLGVNEAELGLVLIGGAIGSLISLTLSAPSEMTTTTRRCLSGVFSRYFAAPKTVS